VCVPIKVWSGKCVATGLRQGHGKIMSLTRWDRSKPPSVSNLVLLASAEVADRFDEEVGEELYRLWLWL
jgi:hypothetical protein